jgi:hypothetical protein
VRFFLTFGFFNLWHTCRNSAGKAKEKNETSRGPEEERTMTRQLVKAMTMLMLVVALALVSAVASAYGQSNSNAVADIPFEFVAGNKAMAAGHYRLSAATAGGEVVKIREEATNQSVMTITLGLMNNKPAQESKLVFRRYGNKYFLAEIWTAGESQARQLLKTKEEKAIERELASIQSKNKSTGYERIEVALVRQ